MPERFLASMSPLMLTHRSQTAVPPPAEGPTLHVSTLAAAEHPAGLVDVVVDLQSPALVSLRGERHALRTNGSAAPACSAPRRRFGLAVDAPSGLSRMQGRCSRKAPLATVSPGRATRAGISVPAAVLLDAAAEGGQDALR